MSKARDELQEEITRLMDVYWGISGHNLKEKRPLYTEAILSQVDTYVKEREDAAQEQLLRDLADVGEIHHSVLDYRLEALQAKKGKANT